MRFSTLLDWIAPRTYGDGGDRDVEVPWVSLYGSPCRDEDPWTDRPCTRRSGHTGRHHYAERALSGNLRVLRVWS